MRQRLDNLAEISIGYPFRGKIQAAEDGDIPVIQIKDINASGYLDLSGATRIRSDGQNFAKHYLQAGDVLLQSRGHKHPVSLFEFSDRAIAAGGVHILRPRPNRVRPQFLAWLLNHPMSQAKLADSARGSHIPFIGRADVEGLTVPAPPLHVQDQIVAAEILRRREQQLAVQLDVARSTYLDSLLWRSATANHNKKD